MRKKIVNGKILASISTLLNSKDSCRVVLAEKLIAAYVDKCCRDGDIECIEYVLKEIGGVRPKLASYIRKMKGEAVFRRRQCGLLDDVKSCIREDLRLLDSLGFWSNEPDIWRCNLCLKRLSVCRFFFGKPDQEFYNLEWRVRNALLRARKFGMVGL